MKKFLFKKRRELMIVISGFLTSLTLIASDLGFIEWLSLIPVAIALVLYAEDREIGYKKIYGKGVLFFMCYYLVVYHWFLYMYPLEFAGVSKWAAAVVVLFAWLGLSLIQTIGSALIFVLIIFVYRLGVVKKVRFLLPVFAAAIWTVFEWAQTIGWWGVPWGRLCLGQSNATLFLRSSAVLGSYFVSFVIVAVNFCLAYLIVFKDRKKLLVSMALSLFCLNIALGLIVTLSYHNEGESVRFAAVQGNISTSEKWGEGTLDKTLSIHKKHTMNAALNGADVIVWSETALPYNFFEDEYLVSYMSELAKNADATILFSAFTEGEGADYSDFSNDGLYNSLIELKSDGSYGDKVYYKQRLVPFGEFVPMRSLIEKLIPPLAEIGLLGDDLLFGEKTVVLDSSQGKIGCGICFDSIYESISRKAVLSGAEILVVSTNDSWFSDSAALEMHNSQSQLRAIETGRYLVRSANTGISSIIDPLGREAKRLGALEDGVIYDDVYMRNNITLYTYIGNLFVYLCIALIAGIIVSDMFFKKID